MTWRIPSEPCTLSLADIHVWRSALNLSAEKIQTLARTLSADEQARAQQFRFEVHRDRFIAARGILRSLLGQYLNQVPEAITFCYGEHGKPTLAQASSLKFNLAHSQDLALYAFCHHGPIGIDLEQIRPIEHLNALADRFFSAQEAADIRQTCADRQTHLFFRYWTCKEAYLKATGIGLAGLNSVEITLSPQPAIALKAPKDNNLSNWQLQELSVNSEFAGALCLPSTPAPQGISRTIQYFEWRSGQ